MPTSCGAATFFEWNEEFDYDGTNQMVEAGWVLEQPQYTHMNGSAMVLDGTTVDTVVRYLNFPAGIEDWRIETRSMWIGGNGGTAGVNLVTDKASYSFWIDGWYSRMNFSVNDTTTTFGSQVLQEYQWYTLSMERRGGNISLYQEGEYVYGRDFTTPIGQALGVSYISPWRGITQYDYIRFSTDLGDEPVIEWQYTYGGESSDDGYSAAHAPDGGYVVAGVTQSGSRGGFDACLFKLRPDGTEEWRRTYGGASGDWVYSIASASGGGYIMVGASASFAAGVYDLWLIRVDDSGNEIWNYSYGTELRDAGFSVVQTSDGGFAATGYKEVSGYGADVWLLKVDAEGTEEWNMTFGGDAEDWGKVLVQTSDGGFAVAGWTQSEAIGTGQTMGYFVRYDSGGNPLWDRTYGAGGSTLFYGAIQTDDDGFILGGHTDTTGSGGDDLYVVWIDANGNTIRERAYGGAGDETGTGIFQLGDGFIFGGSGNSYDPSLTKILMVRTDMEGNATWMAWYGLDTVPVSGSIALRTSDGGFLLVGLTNEYASGSDDAYVAKLGWTVVPGEDSLLQRSAGPVAAVVVGSAIGLLAVAAAGTAAGSVAGSAAGTVAGPTGWLDKVVAGFKKLLPLDKLEDFVEGYARFQSRAYITKAESKYRKPEAMQRTPFLAGFSLREIMVVSVTSVLLGFAYMVAKRKDLLDPSTILVFLLVAGFAILLHDLTHRYVASKFGAVAEYKFWGLGMVLMVITSVFFGVVYAYPAKTVINDPKKLTAKQQAIVFGAGPLVSLGVFGLFLLFIPLGGWFLPIALLACSMNLLSAVYSFMPFEPMDGRQVLKWKKLAWVAIFVPLLILFLVMTIYVF